MDESESLERVLSLSVKKDDGFSRFCPALSLGSRRGRGGVAGRGGAGEVSRRGVSGGGA
jgi:ribosomal protein L15